MPRGTPLITRTRCRKGHLYDAKTNIVANKNGVPFKQCGICRAAAQLKWNLSKRYGLAVGAYERMFQEQGGGCWICGSQPKTRRLNIDHNHKTGIVRGLLCWSCNAGLGKFRDNPDRLRRAALYLERT